MDRVQTPRRRRNFARAAAFALLMFAASAASAQDVPVFNPAPVRASRQPSPLLGTSFEPIVRLGQDLLGFGILPRLRYVQSFAANPVGGITQGTDTSGVVLFGADVDLNRTVQLPAPSSMSLSPSSMATNWRPTTSAPGPRCSRSTTQRSNSSWRSWTRSSRRSCTAATTSPASPASASSASSSARCACC